MTHLQREIAIITLYDDFNIGNKLQNYALQEVIKTEGYAPVTIDTHSFGRWHLSWKGWLVALLGLPRKASHHRRLMLRRKPRFRNFSEQYLNVRGPYSYQAILDGCLHSCDAFVCGSDQVWHHWTKKPEELDYFFLRFAERKKRVCYAPSFGFDEVPEDMKERYREGLLGFDRLSCREQSGCELIRALTDRDAERLCDPTMLLTAEQWDGIALKPQQPLPERYLLTYFLGDKSKQVQRTIADYAKKEKLAVVNVYCMEFSKENDAFFCTRPDEFLYLIRHAAYVCTDSFHGTVFSILYHKEFTTFQRTGPDGSMMRGRLQTLLALFHLEQCGDAGHMGQQIDYAPVDKLLAAEREKGRGYLRKALAKAVAKEESGRK